MSDQSGSKLRIPCWHLWSDGHGISRQTRCSLKEWELKGVDAAAARRNNKHPRSKAIVVLTTQLISRVGKWHENPAPNGLLSCPAAGGSKA